MARGSNRAAPLMIPLALAAGGGLLWAFKAHAKTKPPRPTPDDDPPDDTIPSLPDVAPSEKPDKPAIPDKPSQPKPDPLPDHRRLLGEPFRPGRSNEAHNAAMACKRKPKRHPNGYARGATQKRDDWLANVAYWESYPQGPLQIKDPVKHRKYAQSWLRIRAHVRKCLGLSQKPDKVPDPDVPESGTKFPDRGAEIRNAALAVEQKPQTYPRLRPPNNKRQPGQALHAYLTNVAYWETYPGAPVKLTTSKAHAKYRTAWMRINGLVKVGLAKEAQSKKDMPAQTVPGPGASPQSDGGKTEPAGEAPPPKPSTNPNDIAAATEMRNAAVVAVDQPTKYDKKTKPYNTWKGTNAKQSITDWLTNVAYWESYPQAPTRLNPKDDSHKRYITAWLRLRDYVARSLDAQKKVPADPPGGGVPPRGWKIWAASMPNASAVRSTDAIVKAWAAARRYFATPSGSAIAKRDTGLSAGPRTTTLSGLLAEAASRNATGKLTSMPEWKTKPTRSFWVTTGLF
ncbi:MAG: hypothetical protein B7733_18635 [Myxococcales bacterium FL481]|nr:MAG: hypothetical protein B7733_18635 [Myxococcales bacterium FL481]